MGFYGCIELASGSVGRLTPVDYFKGLFDLKLMGFAAILHLSEIIQTNTCYLLAYLLTDLLNLSLFVFKTQEYGPLFRKHAALC